MSTVAISVGTTVAAVDAPCRAVGAAAAVVAAGAVSIEAWAAFAAAGLQVWQQPLQDKTTG